MTVSTFTDIHSIKDKLRTITDEAWSQQGSQLVSPPVRRDRVDGVLENLAHFEVEAQALPNMRGVSLTIPLAHAQERLASVSAQDLKGWALGD